VNFEIGAPLFGAPRRPMTTTHGGPVSDLPSEARSEAAPPTKSEAKSEPRFSLTLDRVERYRFDATFDDDAWPTVRLDEPEPLGEGTGPNASRMLGAAIGNCLSASLLFCLDKARVPVGDVTAHVEGRLRRNERGRLRIGEVKVTIRPRVDGVPRSRLARCLELFEDFCLVTQSVREGIDVKVDVEPLGAVEE
jgi:organic hydroperoxide reductase OsmC/OhrA